jgi:hypothetical protein
VKNNTKFLNSALPPLFSSDMTSLGIQQQRPMNAATVSNSYRDERIKEGDIKVILLGDSAVGKSKLVEVYQSISIAHFVSHD